MSLSFKHNTIVEPSLNIIAIDVDHDGYGFIVGNNGISAITLTHKMGNHGPIPYLQVWKGEHLAVEFCQHALSGVHYGVPA